jgi:putative tributyrin esterase
MPTVATLQYESMAMRGPVDCIAIWPNHKDVPPPYHVLIQLHGMYDTYTSWLHRTRLLQYVRAMPLITILPSGGNFLWGDLSSNQAYEAMIIEDLCDFVKAMFPIKEGKWAIGGLSMGGGGALRLAMKHPDLFGSVWGHSNWLPPAQTITEWYGVDSLRADDLDVMKNAAKMAVADAPQIGFDCGEDDFPHIVQQNKALDALLTERGIPHTYNIHPGGHDWAYWDTHVRTALKQHAAYFNIAGPTE